MRCMTLGCKAEATHAMHYTMAGDSVRLSDNVCVDCLEHYSNRPAIHVLFTTEPQSVPEILAPGLR